MRVGRYPYRDAPLATGLARLTLVAKPDAQKQVVIFEVSTNAIPEGEKRRPHRTIAIDANTDL